MNIAAAPHAVFLVFGITVILRSKVLSHLLSVISNISYPFSLFLSPNLSIKKVKKIYSFTFGANVLPAGFSCSMLMGMVTIGVNMLMTVHLFLFAAYKCLVFDGVELGAGGGQKVQVVGDDDMGLVKTAEDGN